MDADGASGQNVGNIHPECTEAGISAAFSEWRTGPSAVHLDT